MSDISTTDDDDFIDEVGDGEGDEGGSPDPHEGEDGEDEAEGEDDEGEGQEGLSLEGREPARRPNDSYRRLKERAKAAEARSKESDDRATRFEREIGEIRQQLGSQQHQPSAAEQARLQQEEDERLALMTPGEQARYLRDQITRSVRDENQRMALGQREENDRTRFQDMQRTNPLARKYATEVENLVREQRSQGLSTPREVALAFLIGRKALDKVSGGATPSREQRGRVSGSRAQSTRGGTESRSSGRERQGDDSEAALERRLAGTVF